jgi:hypothetical protein
MRATRTKFLAIARCAIAHLRMRHWAHGERAIDDLRKKFGQTAVIRGIAYDGPEKAG